MDPTPSSLGPYEIRGTIGSGAMGIVYRGWDARLRRHVAIKTLLPALAADPQARERFLREARAVAAVSHPNVTQIHDIGEAGGTVYFAMELLEGRSLQELLAERTRLGSAEAVSIVRQAAAGLRAAAASGIVHRDVKPSNLLLAADGTVRITDFGLAKQLVTDSNLTSEGQFFGTPNYIAPEQAGGGRADARSDIYALGATLYEMVAGRPPFRGESPVTVVLQHLRDPVPPVRTLNPAVPQVLATLIHRMLSKSPAARPQDYDELLRQLERVAASGELQGPPARSEAARTLQHPVAARRTGSLVAYAALGLLALAAAGAMLRPPESARGTQSPASGQGPQRPSGPGTATAARTIGTAAAPARAVPAGHADLTLRGVTHEITTEGLLRVHGEVHNAGPDAADAVIVRVVLTGDDGQTVGSLEVPVLPVRLDPGADGAFEAYFPDPRRRVNVLLELNWVS